MSRLRWVGITLVLGGFALVACVSASRFGGQDPADPCAAARAGQPPFQGADLERGARLFASDCSQCHGLGSGSRARPAGEPGWQPGPDLAGVVERPIGSAAFPYSKAFDARRSERWTLAALDRYLEEPGWFVPGTRMRFAGLSDAGARLAVIAYLACEAAPSRER